MNAIIVDISSMIQTSPECLEISVSKEYGNHQQQQFDQQHRSQQRQNALLAIR
jgi:hypothetical protein